MVFRGPQLYVPVPGPVAAERLPFSPDNPDDRSDSRDARWQAYAEEYHSVAEWCAGEVRDSVTSGDRHYLYIELLTAGGYITVSDGSWVFNDDQNEFHTMTHREFLSAYKKWPL